MSNDGLLHLELMLANEFKLYNWLTNSKSSVRNTELINLPGFNKTLANKLRQIDVITLADLLQKTDAQLLAIKGINKVSVRRIKDLLKAHGFNFAQEASKARNDLIKLIRQRLGTTKQKIIFLRFALERGEKLDHTSIAEELNLKVERVKELERQALYILLGEKLGGVIDIKAKAMGAVGIENVLLTLKRRLSPSEFLIFFHNSPDGSGLHEAYKKWQSQQANPERSSIIDYAVHIIRAANEQSQPQR